MAWNDAAELIVAGTGEVYVAEVGTGLPTDADDSLNAAFEGLGFHTEDGVSISDTPDIAEFRAWQSRQPIRRERQTDDFQLSFSLQQWNEVNVPLAFGGGEVVSVGSGQYRYNPPQDEDALDERAVICDVIDGDRRARFVIPRGSATETVDSQFTRGQTAVLPITIKALEPADGSEAWYVLFNDAAFAAGS